jgi:hypothetical protein
MAMFRNLRDQRGAAPLEYQNEIVDGIGRHPAGRVVTIKRFNTYLHQIQQKLP